MCYGEKGIYHSLMTSADVPVEQRTVISLEGGTAVNAVPGHAQAVVRAGCRELPAAQGIEVELLDEREAAAALEAAGTQTDAAGCRLARITAAGRSAHASLPQGGVSAIGMLIGYLLENGLIGEGSAPTSRRLRALRRQRTAARSKLPAPTPIWRAHHRSGPCRHAGRPLHADHRRALSTAITGDEVHAKLEALAQAASGTCEKTRDDAPFCSTRRDRPSRRCWPRTTRQRARDAEPFTMGGGTYAREFSRAASFGPEKPWEQAPEWVGGMHGPDEGVGRAAAERAFRIYALTIGKLMKLDL